MREPLIAERHTAASGYVFMTSVSCDEMDFFPHLRKRTAAQHKKRCPQLKKKKKSNILYDIRKEGMRLRLRTTFQMSKNIYMKCNTPIPIKLEQIFIWESLVLSHKSNKLSDEKVLALRCNSYFTSEQ